MQNLDAGWDPIMTSPISLEEVELTYNSSKGASGSDHITSALLDCAERDSMSACKLFIFNELWREGKFPNQWKQEIRSVLTKPDKDHYHKCNSYRTISLTSILGKRFEKISGRRVISILEEKGFDRDQYAYLTGRSATQACTYFIEKIATGLAEKKSCGAIFFDFTDAFGSVNRALLLKKIYLDFGIRGNLFLHLADFLSNRKACLKLGGARGEWLDSHTGTSAGTVLGPILFIIQGHDAPSSVKPKFADDFNVISVEDTPGQLQSSLQKHADAMAVWASRNDLPVNLSKTVFMQFGKPSPGFQLFFNSAPIKEVSEHRSLGLWVDSGLTFRKHVEVKCSTASACLSKLFPLVKGRRGLSINIGINCYKALMRCHLEYAAPAWWFRGKKFMKEMQAVQYRALRSTT